MIDWAPTLCDLGGCTVGPYPNGQERPDGLSFATTLADEPFPWERDAILLSVPSGGDRPVFWALRTTADDPQGRWLYVENLDGFRELYELGEEPCESWESGDPGDPCLLENRLAGEPDAEMLAFADALSARLAELKVEQAPVPLPRTDAP
jgi:hypothetical protein